MGYRLEHARMKWNISTFICLLIIHQSVSAQLTNTIVPAQQLLHPYRIDIMAKFLYAKYRECCLESSFAKDLYAAHLWAWGMGRFIEENPPKSSLADFIHAFHTILDAIKTDTFDWNHHTKVPVWTADHNFICDGSHRTAAALLYQKNVHIKLHESADIGQDKGTLTKYDIFNIANKFHDFFYFKKLKLDDTYLDAMALQYCYLQKNCYIAVVFPAAIGKQSEVQQILHAHGDIVAMKEIILTNNGAHNLLRQAYDQEGWVHNSTGAKARVKASFGPDASAKPTKIYLIAADSIEQVRAAKEKIRTLFGFRESIHTTDTHEQAIKLAQIAFVKNSIHFVNYSNQRDFKNFKKYMHQFKSWMAQHNIDPELVCVDGSAIMAAYGLRDCADLDFIHHGFDEQALHTGIPGVSSHNDELPFHRYPKDEIICNPRNFFYYQGVKFASLAVLKAMKTKRDENPKDRRDIQLINKVPAL